MKRLVMLAVMVLGFLVLARPALAQWPTVQMYYGGPLKEAVFVTGADSAAFGNAFAAVNVVNGATTTAATMGDRPYVTVACFWGSVDDPATNGTKIPNLKPETAWQHGRFYPATADHPAALFVTSLGQFKQMRSGSAPRVFGIPPPTNAAAFLLTNGPSPAALAVLKRLGVPTGPR